MPRKACFTCGKNVFAERLTAIMKERGENQTTLAEKITEQYVPIQRQTISLYMNGQSKPDTERIAAIAKVLHVSADYLLGITDTASDDVSVQTICKFTGLSEKAATRLKQMNSDSIGAGGKGYTISNFSILDDLICSDLFLPFLGDLGLYFIYGGGLPSEAYTREAQELSIAEINRFYEWANNQGLEVIARKDVSEMYLQKACDILKKIAKQCLEEQVESLRKNTDTH